MLHPSLSCALAYCVFVERSVECQWKESFFRACLFEKETAFHCFLSWVEKHPFTFVQTMFNHLIILLSRTFIFFFLTFITR